jgi:hypothetical protein
MFIVGIQLNQNDAQNATYFEFAQPTQKKGQLF